MSKISQHFSQHLLRGLIAAMVLGVFVGPGVQAQLRERNRLKTPLLRLPHLGKRKDAQQSPNHSQVVPNQVVPGQAVPGQIPPNQMTPGGPVAGNPANVQPGPLGPLAVKPGNASPGNAAPFAQPTPVPAAGSLGAIVPTQVATPPLPAIGQSGVAPLQPTVAPQPATSALPPLSQPNNPVPLQTAAPMAAPNTSAPINVASSNTGQRTQSPPPPAPVAPVAPVALTPAQTMDLALNDAERALAHMRANVRDYQCNFSKRERVGDVLVPREVATLKVRNRVVKDGRLAVPLGVYFKFSLPANVKGREALFVEGQNNDKLLCKEGGTRGRFLPALWLNQNSSFIMSTNRYPISQIGMTRLAERLIENGRESPVDDCQVKYIQGAKVNGRICSYLQVIRPTPRPGLPVGHNNVYCAEVFIDTELKMPVRFVAYDWPAAPGGSPRLIEEYMYYNISVNTGLTDKDFSSKNPAYRF